MTSEQSKFEQKIATITEWVVETKAKNEELEKEVRRVTGELTHLQESGVKPMERVLVPMGLYNYQSYADCITATVKRLEGELKEARELLEIQAENALKLACVIDERDALQASLVEAEADAEALRELSAWSAEESGRTVEWCCMDCEWQCWIGTGRDADVPIVGTGATLAAAIMDAITKVGK